jgi:carbon monoxide dehydrogenase subunit G
MPSTSATRTIAGVTPQEIFDFLADYRNIGRIQPQFTSVKLAGEIERGVGAVMELRGRFHGMPMEVKSRIITFTPPSRIVSISEGTVLSRNAWELEELDTDQPSTRVSFIVDYKVGGPLGKVFTGVASSLFHREIESMTREALHHLEEYFRSS